MGGKPAACFSESLVVDQERSAPPSGGAELGEAGSRAVGFSRGSGQRCVGGVGNERPYHRTRRKPNRVRKSARAGLEPGSQMVPVAIWEPFSCPVRTSATGQFSQLWPFSYDFRVHRKQAPVACSRKNGPRKRVIHLQNSLEIARERVFSLLQFLRTFGGHLVVFAAR